MSKKSFIDTVKVDSPCSEDWNEMQGTDKIRFCSHCAKHVNNLSEMTRKQATRLVRASNGNLCIRYIADPATKRPMFAGQLLQITRRRPGIAAGVMSASIALSAQAYAQESAPVPPTPRAIEQTRTAEEKREREDAKVGGIKGTVVDPNGAVIVGVSVEVTNKQSNERRRIVSNEEGVYTFRDLRVGTYEISHEAPYGFKRLTILNIDVSSGTVTSVSAPMEIAAGEMLMGVVAYAIEYELPLSGAIIADDVEEVRNLIISGAKVNDKEKEDKSTPLFIAVENGNVEIIEILLNFGAKVNARDASKQTPLMRIDDDATPELVDLLIRYGAKVDLVDREGNTALILAAGRAKPEVIKALIDAGAPVRAKNKEGQTALMEAASNDDLETVKLLLESGAEVNAKNKEGETAWDLTTDDEVEELLVTYGAEVHEADDESESADDDPPELVISRD